MSSTGNAANHSPRRANGEGTAEAIEPRFPHVETGSGNGFPYVMTVEPGTSYLARAWVAAAQRLVRSPAAQAIASRSPGASVPGNTDRASSAARSSVTHWTRPRLGAIFRPVHAGSLGLGHAPGRCERRGGNSFLRLGPGGPAGRWRAPPSPRRCAGPPARSRPSTGRRRGARSGRSLPAASARATRR